MSHIVRIPQLHSAAGKVTVTRCSLQPGDLIALNQAVLEVEDDNLVLIISADGEGVVETIHVAEGDEVVSHQRILTLRAPRPEEAGALAALAAQQARLEKRNRRFQLGFILLLVFAVSGVFILANG